MENKRALSIIEKSDLSLTDKRFLLTHIETYEYLLQSKEIDLMQKNDIIEYSNYLNHEFLAVKEHLIRAGKTKNNEKILKKIEFLYKYVNKEEKS